MIILETLLSIIILAFMIFPFIFVFNLHNSEYLFLEDRLIVKLFKLKIISIQYSNIKSLEKIEQFPYIKNFPLNKAIKVYFNKRFFLNQYSILYSKNIDEIFQKINSKINNDKQ